MTGGGGGLCLGFGTWHVCDFWRVMALFQEKGVSQECLRDTRKCQESRSLPVTGDSFLRWFSRRDYHPVTQAFEKPETLRVERSRTPLQLIANRYIARRPHLPVKEAIVDSSEADVENQSSAMQRTRLS